MVQRRSFPGILARGIALAALALFCLFLGLLAFDSSRRQVSTLMIGRTIEGKSYERAYAPLKDVAEVAIASIIASEDARFCENRWRRLGRPARKSSAAPARYGPKRGASTITMQTAKNLFLVARGGSTFARAQSRHGACSSARSGRRRIRIEVLLTQHRE